jgi:hypothetical protein
MLGRSEVDVEELREGRNEHSTTTGTTDHSSYMYPRQASLLGPSLAVAPWHMSSSLGGSTQRMQPTRPSDGTWKRKPHSPPLLVRYRGMTLRLSMLLLLFAVCPGV